MPATRTRQPAAREAGRPRKSAALRTAAVTKRDDSTLQSLARELRSWTDSVLGVASTAAMSFNVAKALLPTKPGQRSALHRAGALVRNMRESAGLSLKELGKAIDLKDPSLLEAVEGGTAALPFEIIMRLAAVLARNDPIPFVMKLTRTNNPALWKVLEDLGVGRLVLQSSREREFAHIYSVNDRARRLSDEDFAAVLDFTRSAFNTAMAFRDRTRKARAPRPDVKPETESD
ncbi:MAG: helix-turn-helix transcriptional regulator [Sterolibacteriaceae bacterium]|nr:helix-turn-helix transcriptional regulator [Sterolibacteriaceae bacterium]MBK9084746.1 helix-turn-helix transcriptional regulator [Sterolibacteriaceae bacterium]